MYLDRAKFITLFQGGSDLYRLFANGEDGFLFGNFGDLTRLFTTSQGPTQVANDADPVGLALEDSKWSKRTLAQQVAQALEIVSNGTFNSNTTGWTSNSATLAVDAQRLRCTTTGTGDNGATQDIAAVVGATYRISADITNASVSAAAAVRFCPTDFSVTNLSQTVAAGQSGTVVMYAVATSTTMRILLDRRALGAVVGDVVYFDNVSVKAVTGNHGLQATTSARPFYKPNSGKPYLLYDGSDDAHQTPFVVPAAVTMACAVRATSDGTFIGGGSTGSNTRCRIYQTVGNVAVAWGSNGALISASASAGVDRVVVATGDATSVDLWIDGVLAATSAPSGSPAGGSAFAIGGWNNGGTLTSFGPARHYADMVLNRRVTPAEIALITSRFRSTYQ